MRAAAGNRSSQATVTVVQVAEGASLPAGTVRWSSPPLATRAVTNILQARKVDETTPDFYVEEEVQSQDAGKVLRAFTASGLQQWVWPADGADRRPRMFAGDNSGGVLAYSDLNGASQLSSIDKNGTELWHIPFADSPAHAIHPDGTIYLVDRFSAVAGSGRVVGYAPTSGAEVRSILAPTSSQTQIGARSYFNVAQNRTYTICDPAYSGTLPAMSQLGQLVIDDQGFTWVPAAALNSTTSFSCSPTFDSNGIPLECTCATVSTSYTSTLYVLKIGSDGSLTTTQIDSLSATVAGLSPSSSFVVGAFAPTIPDGHGGAVFASIKPDLSPAIYRSTGVQFPSPVGSVNQMLLGENDTVFVSGNSGTAATTLAGSSAWQNAMLTIPVAALNEGSLLAQTTTLKRFDSAGASSDFTGGGPLTASTYVTSDFWAVGDSSGGLALIASLYVPSQQTSVPTWGLAQSSHPANPGSWRVHCSPQRTGGFNLSCFERPLPPGTSAQTNYNAIKLLTNQSPQQVFELIRTFDASLNGGTNSVARLLSQVPVNGVGDRVKFELKLNPSDFCIVSFPVVPCLPQGPFTVAITRYEPSSFTMSAVTMTDHPLAGWRFWRVTQTAPGEVLIETGAVDTPIGPEANIGNWVGFIKSGQVKIWKEYLLDIQRRLQAVRSNDPNYDDNKLEGVWNLQAPPKSYLLTGICGADQNGFCWYAQ